MQRPLTRAVRCARVLSRRSWCLRLTFGVLLLGAIAAMSATMLYGQSSDQALFIDQNGNVGIGTSAPKGFQVTLPEASKQSSAPGEGVTIAGGANASIELRGTGTPYIDFAKDADQTDHHARIWLTATDQLTIDTANVRIPNTLTITGNVGIGTPKPATRLDVQDGTREGTHSGSVKGLYVTGDFSEAQGVEFRHNNGAQGIGFGSNTIYATGSTKDQDLKIKSRGNGTVAILPSQESLFISGRDGTVSVTNNAYRDAENNWVIKTTTKKASTIELRDNGEIDLYVTQTDGKTDWSRIATFNADGVTIHNGKLRFPGGQKMCSVIVGGQWRDTTLVPATWTKDQCKKFQNLVGASVYQLGCIFDNDISLGGNNGGTPSPNCGW